MIVSFVREIFSHEPTVKKWEKGKRRHSIQILDKTFYFLLYVNSIEIGIHTFLLFVPFIG